MKILVKFIILLFFFNCSSAIAKEINLNEFEKKLIIANQLMRDKAKNIEETKILKILNALNKELKNKTPNKELLTNALTIINSTNILEDNFPNDIKISFPDNFLVGSNLNVADLTNASFFLNSLNKKKLVNLKKSNLLSLNASNEMGDLQKKAFEFYDTSPNSLIAQLEKLPKLDLLELSLAIEKNAKNIEKDFVSVKVNIDNSGVEKINDLSKTFSSSTSQIKQISNVSDHISSATTQMKQVSNVATQINSATTQIDQVSNQVNKVSSQISSVTSSISRISSSVISRATSKYFRSVINKWHRKQKNKRKRRRN